MRTRQPLGRALVHAPGWNALPGELKSQVIDELNVRVVVADDGSGDLLVVDTVVKANFRALGKRFGNRTQVVAAAVAAANAAELALAIAETGSVSVEVDGEQVVLSADELVVTETPTLGWAVASDGGFICRPRPRTHGGTPAGRHGPGGHPLCSGKLARPVVWRSVTASSSGGRRQTTGWSRLCANTRRRLVPRSSRSPSPRVDRARNITPHTDAELGLTIWMRVAGG